MEHVPSPPNSSISQNKYFYLVIILPLGIANSSDATEILCLSYILADPTFQSTMLLGNSGAYLAGSIFAGMLFGGLLLTVVGESPIKIRGQTILLGRRRPWVLAGLALNSLAGFASAFAPSIQAMTLIRTIAGFGIGISVPPLFTLVSELSPPILRGFCVSLVASFWMIGSLFVATAAWIIFSSSTHLTALSAWRSFAMVCSLPSFTAFILTFIYTPESPRYLHIHHQSDEAKDNERIVSSTFSSKASNLYYREDVTHYSLPTSSKHSENHRIICNRTNNFECIRPGNLESLRVLYLDSHLAKGTTIPLTVLWFSLCFGSYGLFTWINSIFASLKLPNIYFQSFLFASANLPGNIASVLLVDRLGRKKLLVSSMILAAFSLISLSLYAHPMWNISLEDPMNDNELDNSTNQTHNDLLHTVGIILSACSFQACIICGWNMIDCLTSESFPTNVRNSGVALCTAWGRIGAMVAQLINGFLMSNHPSPTILLFIASLSLLIGAAVPFWMKGEDMTLKLLSDFHTELPMIERQSLI